MVSICFLRCFIDANRNLLGVEIGVSDQGGAMLLLFQFYGNDGKPLITFDAPYDVRLLPTDNRSLHNIDNAEQRLAIEIHAVDEKKILRALRVVTMPPSMTMAFLSAVQDQLAAIRQAWRHGRMAATGAARAY